MENVIRSANERSFESYARSPHFDGGDRRQDFDNGWDEALEWIRPLLERWSWGPARGEAIDLADETDELLSILRRPLHGLSNHPGDVGSSVVQRESPPRGEG